MVLSKIAKKLYYEQQEIGFTLICCALLSLLYIWPNEVSMMQTVIYLGIGYLLIFLLIIPINTYYQLFFLLNRWIIYAIIGCILLLIYPNLHNNYYIYFMATLLAWILILIPAMMFIFAKVGLKQNIIAMTKMKKLTSSLTISIAIVILFHLSINLGFGYYFPLWVVSILVIYIWGLFSLLYLLSRLKLKRNIQVIEALIKQHKNQQTRLPIDSIRAIYAYLLAVDDNSSTELAILIKLLAHHLNRRKQVKVSDEIHYLNQFIHLQAYQFGETVDVQCQSNIKVAAKKIPPLILLPIVSNAYHQGVASGVEWPFIHITIETSEQQLHFCVESNSPQNTRLETFGQALTPVIKQLDAVYGAKYQFEITQLNAVYLVNLVIPLD